MAIRSIRFHDISNNTYDISADMVSYRPVTPDMSSSGIYSGGTPMDVSISEDTYEKILILALELGLCVHLHQNVREKMTSRLFITLHDDPDQDERSYGYNLSNTKLTRAFTDLLQKTIE